MKTIPLGFEMPSGTRVNVPLRHLCVTGQTQLSGKTTTLEALVTRSKLKAIAFITKRGEGSFRVAEYIAPFFRERADWQFVASILEATLNEKLKFHRSCIMTLCEKKHGSRGKHDGWDRPKTLADVLDNVNVALGFARGIKESIYTELREYLRMVLPELDRLPYTDALDLKPGLNVMDLSAYDFPVQSLVIAAVMRHIRTKEKGVITIVPEAWKFIPQGKGSPVRMEAEQLIREGAAESVQNFVWFDSQDIAGVDKVLFRSVGVWILGVQREIHELKRALGSIPISPAPRAEDIATLKIGEFFVSFDRELHRTYVQPAWMDSDTQAEAIARGEESVESARYALEQYDKHHRKPKPIPETPKMPRAMSLHEAPVGVAVADMAKNGQHPPEPNWKERYETLLREKQDLEHAHDALALRVRELENRRPVHEPFERANETIKEKAREVGALPMAANPAMGPAVLTKENPGWAPFYVDAMLAVLRKRAREDPAVIDLVLTSPELRVRRAQPVLEYESGSTKGRIVAMLQDGFFAVPRSIEAVKSEIVRRGDTPKRAFDYLENFCTELTSWGLLSREAEGFLATQEKR